MGKVFSVQDRQAAFEYILSVAAECCAIITLISDNGSEPDEAGK